MEKEKLREVDVICLNSSDGTIIPMRVRMTDDDGLRQAYNIKEYRDLSHQGTRTTPDGVYVTNNTLIYECKILVLDRIRTIRLYFDSSEMIWRMVC